MPSPRPDRPDRSVGPALEAVGLVKAYDDVVAVDHVDLSVAQGDVVGLLGPNGAGKTTFLRMLLGLVRPDAGRILVAGRSVQPDPVAALAQVGGFVETPAFYPYLTGRQNLRLLARLDRGRGADEVGGLLERVGLADKGDTKVKGWSFGMVQRLGVAAALLRDPELLVLDEPTNGLDPAGLRDLRSLVADLAADGATVVLSSHQMAEVDLLCNRAAILRHGALVFDGSLEELRHRAREAPRRLLTDDDARAEQVCATLPGVRGLTRSADHLAFDADDATVEDVVRRLVEAGVGVRSLHAPVSALEALFFRLTGDDAGRGAAA